MANPASVSYREVTDANGRMFRVGEEPAQILGRSRSYMVWLPWVAMMAAGVFEYAYGSAAKTLQASYDWSDTQTFTLTGVWGFFQAGIALAGCGLFFKDPPKNWWPSSVDPIRWSADKAARKTLAKNPPAVRNFTPAEAYRTPQIWIMWCALVCTSSVSFFGINFLVNSPRPATSRCMSR